MPMQLEQIKDELVDYRDWIDQLPDAWRFQTGPTCRRGCQMRMWHAVGTEAVLHAARKMDGEIASDYGLHFMLELHRPDCLGLTVASVDYRFDRAWLTKEAAGPDGPVVQQSTTRGLAIARDQKGVLYTENAGSESLTTIYGPKDKTEEGSHFLRMAQPAETLDIELALAAMRMHIAVVINEPQPV